VGHLAHYRGASRQMARAKLWYTCHHRLAMHVIRYVQPSLPVREYVRYYAHREVRLYHDVVVHPVPARAVPILEFDFGDPIRVLNLEQSVEFASPTAVVIGMTTHCRLQLRIQGVLECFAILFRPTGFHRLFSVPMQELTDRAYEAHSVLGALASRLEQRLGECRTFEERVRVADEFLSRRALELGGLDGVSDSASRILLSGSSIQITDLAENTGLSIRQFERSFIRQVGMRPKLFARIARFEAALSSKACSSGKSWTEVAHEFGYYDQMHLVHDFQEFTGGSPTSTLRQFEVLFRDQIRAARSSTSSEKSTNESRLIL
jgi:AraC-like DNA-binding protein